MVNSPSRRKGRPTGWPRKITLGRVTVPIYRRKAPGGQVCFMVTNYAGGKRRFDSYSSETEALEAANRLARRLAEREVLAASLTNAQASEYTAAVETLAPYSVPLLTAASTLAECLRGVGDLPTLLTAVRFYSDRHKRTIPKPVAEVVTELLEVKAKRDASPRYLGDLRFRLGHFAGAFRQDACNVTTAEVQAWLDTQRLAPQSYINYRRVLNLLFEFAVARSYAADNPVAGVETVKAPGAKTEVFTPAEMIRLLAAAAPDFLPCLALGAFAGLRSAEIERLEWSDIHLAERFIVVGAAKAKTATRRVVPIADNLAAWLAPYAACTGPIWSGADRPYYREQQVTAKLAGFTWRSNALRHSYASYRFAELGDAGRVAGELGNSPSMVHRHYRELVTPAQAKAWFAIRPELPANVIPLAAVNG